MSKLLLALSRLNHLNSISNWEYRCDSNFELDINQVMNTKTDNLKKNYFSE